MRRVSYHQSVFDLLDLQPRESPQARRLIEIYERRQGQRLPEAVRQWYLIENVVALRDELGWPRAGEAGHLWYDYSNQDHPEPLEAVLQQFAHELGDRPSWGLDRVRVLVENQGTCSWFIRPDGSDDPPVLLDENYDGESWVKINEHFSAFVFTWMAHAYSYPWTPLSERSNDPKQVKLPVHKKPYLDGLWLYAPSAQLLAPPYLDYLIDHFTEDVRQQIAPGVMQYGFHDEDGTLRVTTDDYREEGGVSAWWLHASSEEGLYRLARKVWWCCDLPTSLKGKTKVALAVYSRQEKSSYNR